jgi:nickel-dependent lactate racemase
MLRPEIVKKLGRAVAERFPVGNHNVFDNTELLGKTTAGTPVHINRDFLRAELKLCVGSILPHGGPGFGGGAKLVLPGVAGVETIYQNHRPNNGLDRGVNRLDGNLMRADMEETAAMAGLDFIVNSVLNPQREVVGLFCGHFVAAHRAGVELARKVYASPAPEGCDVAVVSAYPKDSDCYQSNTALNPVRTAPEPVVHANGTVVIATAGSQGMGEHFLNGPGFRLASAPRISEGTRPDPGTKTGPEQLLFCENVSPHDIARWGGDPDALCRSWPELVRRLRERHGDQARVALFPCGAMQLGAGLA